jgi:hypothetical protein
VFVITGQGMRLPEGAKVVSLTNLNSGDVPQLELTRAPGAWLGARAELGWFSSSVEQRGDTGGLSDDKDERWSRWTWC